MDRTDDVRCELAARRRSSQARASARRARRARSHRTIEQNHDLGVYLPHALCCSPGSHAADFLADVDAAIDALHASGGCLA